MGGCDLSDWGDGVGTGTVLGNGGDVGGKVREGCCFGGGGVFVGVLEGVLG